MTRISTRTCAACRASAPRQTLLRFVEKDGKAVLDVHRHLQGRGAWIHPTDACLNGGLSPRRMSAALRQKIYSTDEALAAAKACVAGRRKPDGTKSATARQAKRKRVGS